MAIGAVFLLFELISTGIEFSELVLAVEAESMVVRLKVTLNKPFSEVITLSSEFISAGEGDSIAVGFKVTPNDPLMLLASL